jgi:hypothetical protein
MGRDLTPYSLEDCIRDWLIRKIPKSTTGYENSLVAASKWLIEAEKTYEAGAFNSSVLCSYLNVSFS